MFAQVLRYPAQIVGPLCWAGLLSPTWAAPAYQHCASADQKVLVGLSTASGRDVSEENSAVDLKIQVKREDRYDERVFPTQERQTTAKVAYTLLDTDIEMLVINPATHEGKLWRGLPGGPNPHITVMCR
ncbi:MAG: hypothetical protein ACK5Y2_11970 [Bdellovibrionales bacterium]